nr:glycosyltransferase [Planctomycetota bacterium]
RGCSAARNHGVATSQGEWIAFLDSDDSWAPDHLESMAAAIEATQGGADFYFADARFEDGAGQSDSQASSLWSKSGFRIDGATRLEADATAWVLAQRQPMKLQCSVFRRRLYEEVGGLDEALRTREDTHFFLKAGIGRSMCAVASGGVAIGVEDDPANRLTLAYPPEQRVYLEATLRLYRDVLAHGPRDAAVAMAYRRELAHRLAVARLGLAKLDLAEGRVASAIRGIAAAAWASPRTLVARLARRLLPRR